MEGLRGDRQWWHSPPPPRNNDHGDRFIPTRSLMNMDFARSSLTPPSVTSPPATFCSPAKQAYRRMVEQNLTLDSEGKPLKMLVFKGTPRKTGGRILLLDEMLHEDLAGGRDRPPPPPVRTLPTSAESVLDAPNMADDYYLNLMDWGRKNMIAIALGENLYLWNAANGETRELLGGGDELRPPTSVRWSADGEKLAVGFADATIEIWDAASARQVRTLEGHTDRVSSLCWNRNLLSSGSRDTSIINHDARARSSSASRFQAHTSDVCGLRWSGTGNLLASGGNDNLVCVWEAAACNRRPSRPLHRLEGHSAAVRALAWCPFQSSVLASGGGTADRCIRLWNTQTGNCAGVTDGGSQVCALEWNRHRKEILSAHGFVHNQLCLWSYPSMSKIGELKGHTSRVLHLAQSPDGSTVASAGADETLRFWKVFGPPPAPRATESHRSSRLSMIGAHIR